MFREIILPIFRSTRLCVTACGIMHRRCCRPPAECCLTFSTSSYLVIYKIAFLHKFHCVQTVCTLSHQHQFWVICPSKLSLCWYCIPLFSFVTYTMKVAIVAQIIVLFYLFVPTFRRDVLPASSRWINLVETDGEIMGRRIRTDLAGRSEGIVSTQSYVGGGGAWIRVCGKSV